MRLGRMLLVMLLTMVSAPLLAEERPALADRLRQLRPQVLAEGKNWDQMLQRSARSRIDAANKRESERWHALQSREDWEKYRNERIGKLRASLGDMPEPPARIDVQVTGKIAGKGYVIENIVFESRPGLVVTANLYQPEKPSPGTPGIVICHSHHNPKTQGELQEMGIGWAKQGCSVIVPDMLGHGERRQHPFTDASKYPGTFRPGRQDYYFRYHVAQQLHLVGESLIGWMAWDLMRCVDVLLQRMKSDPDRIALFGSVAGGGDPAAVAAALDERIKVVAPFNFGGPQPESTFPLPADAEKSFNYAGGGSWESTRNLRLSARDGFLPWVIVGSVAPRKLIHAHEFAWDQEHDPVWKRYEKIYDWYEARDHLAAAHGRGRLSGKPPEATHCNNIGAEHLRSMAPALKKWLAIDLPDAGGARHTAEELRCLTEASKLKARLVYQLAAEIADRRGADRKLDQLPPAQRKVVGAYFLKLLVGGEPVEKPSVTVAAKETIAEVALERITIETDAGVLVPLLLLKPPKAKSSVVVAFSQDGKGDLLQRQAEDIAKLLQAGVTVCLPDLRGTGETRPGTGRGRTSAATSLSATEWMLGQTLLGSRLRDLQTVVAYLRTRNDLASARIALWGDSAARPNPTGQELAAPLDAEELPAQSEPLGDLLAISCAALDEAIVAVYTRGGLSSFRGALNSPYVYIPHDGLIPNLLVGGDLDSWVRLLGARPILRTVVVDARNRPVDKSDSEPPAGWLLKQLKQ